MESKLDKDLEIDTDRSYVSGMKFGNESQIYTMAIISFIVIFILVIPCIVMMSNDCPDGDSTALHNHPDVSRALDGMFHYNAEQFDPREMKTGKILTSCLVHSTDDKNYATATNCSTQPSLAKILRQRRSTGTCTYCCETVWDSIVPLTVSYESVIYDVYHPEGGWQIVIQGVCKEGSNCVTGSCTTADTWYTWILIKDPALAKEPKLLMYEDMMRVLGLLTALLLLGSLEAQVCDDVDMKACGMLLADNPNMCSQTCLSKLCKRTCKMCPLNCYKCDGLDSPTNCTSTEICPSSEHYCIATQSFTDTFEEKYKLGCAHKDICSSIFTKRSATVDGACCDTDLCNGVATSNMTLHPANQMSQNTTQPPASTSSVCADINGEACKLFAAADSTLKSDDCFQKACPRTSDKCFECYFCGSSSTTESCNTTEVCEAGKECYSLETLNADAEITYRLGCMDPKVCSRLGTTANVFGKRQGDISLGVHCCTGDKCNHHHKAVPTTTTAPPTTTSGCSHIDIHNIHHHCPQGFVSIHGSCYMKGSTRMTYDQGKVYCRARCSQLAEFHSHTDLHDVLKHLADIDKHSTHVEDLAVFVGAHHSVGWQWDSDGHRIDNDLFLTTQSIHTNGNCLMAGYHSLVLNGLHNHLHTQEGLVAKPCSSNYAPLCQISEHH